MKQFKKVLAFVLALAMVVTAVPTADAKAAAKAPKLNNTKKILYVGQSYTLKIGNLPANWKKCTYTWSTSNKSIATIKKGKYGQAASVKAVKAGKTTITTKMTYPQTAAQKKAKKKTVKTFKCAVTVKNPSVKFTTTADRIEVGETAQFTAKATPSTAKVTYSSSDAAVATVDATGLVTAVADGTATIKATAKVGTKTVTATKSVEVYTAPTEAKQTKAKEITITSGKVVTKDSKIEVKKGSVEVAPAEKKDGSKDIAIDATGKTVVITTAAKLTKGEYTVTIDGVAANFTAEDEKVTTIEFTSDKAVLDAATLKQGSATDKIYKTATAAYKVYNQFKEDITADTNVQVSGNGTRLKEKGTVEFTSQATDGFRLNDIVAAVVIYNNNGVAVTKSGTFTITNEAAISEITIKDGVYDKKGAAVTLTEDTDLSKGVYVLVSAKDQYGRAVTELTHDGNVLLQSAGGLTNLKLDNTKASIEITVDGVKYAGFKLIKEDTKKAIGAGTATILVISKGTGVTAQGTVTVANGGKVDTISIQVPDLVVGGEDTQLGYTALDSYQKEVTKLSSLLDVQGIKAKKDAEDGEIYAVENPVTGKAELYYKAKDNNSTIADYDVESLLTPTYKATTVNLQIQPNAQPTAIVGTDKLTTGALAGQYFEIVKENIKVADQYGRKDKLKIANYEIFAYFDKKTGNNSFDTTTGALANVTTDITTAKALDVKNEDGTIKATSKAKAVVPADESQADTNVIFVLAKKDTVSLKSNDDKNILSTYPVTFTSSKETNITSYEVADIANVYCGKNQGYGDYSKSFDVKGVTSDGVKVTIPKTDYKVTITGVDTTTGDKLIKNDGKFTAVDLESKADENDQLLTKQDTVEVSLTFTFKDGKQIEKKVTLTKDAPKVKEVKIKDNKEALEVAAKSNEAVTAAETTLANTNAAIAAVKDVIEAVAIGQTINGDELDTATTVEEALAAVKYQVAHSTSYASTLDDTQLGKVKTDAAAVSYTGNGEIGATALANVKAEVIKALTATNNTNNASEYDKNLKAIADAKEGTKIVVAAAILNSNTPIIEAKDQYGVDIAKTVLAVAGKKVNVTVSNAKDAAGNDVTFTAVTNNGLSDATIGGWIEGTKADVKLVFDGGFVFTAKIVAK